jgi:hypothetical protein
MKIVNGKLIDDNQSQIEQVSQEIEGIVERQQFLTSQVTALGRQDYKSFLQKCDRRINSLERIALLQTRELLFLKIGFVVCLIIAGFTLIIISQPERQSPHSTATDIKASPPPLKKIKSTRP